ncbi:MAG: CPBP family intramembrane metalloprotease [Candidatus Aminicenantes bacterium]|nr:CPBP family intramembrane metalloprotease [Candidatus Aminicenantes bacterium]NIQ70556.1 CPBP family intramembrane metalloprotease [Candidatus Aminicenantes bacterium]NIT26597.1 CPBP family intramembrane metalloprotease [Candidatus Aminicenantes bacterium]
MNPKQKIAIIAPLVLVAVMYPIFHALAGVMNDRVAWCLGLAIYWIIWGGIFPLLIIGKEAIIKLIRPRKPDKKIILLVAIPLLGAVAGRLILGGYEKESVWIALLLFSTPFGNGFFEEVLWRGVYLKLFPNNIFFWMIWPSVWFALWHYAPGSVSSGNPARLMIGAGVMGLYLSFLAKKTNTVWWGIVVHTVGGIIMVV